MKKWKIILESESQPVEIIIEANNYLHAYGKAELKYPGKIVKSVSEIKN